MLRQYDVHADTRHAPPTTTPYEALIDILVHSQDALRPLGRALSLAPEAAEVAADRAFGHATMFGRPLDGVRVVATDIEWSRGQGPTVTAGAHRLTPFCPACARRSSIVRLPRRGSTRFCDSVIDWAGSSRTTPRAHRSPGERSAALLISPGSTPPHEETHP